MSIESYEFSDMYHPEVISANETAVVLETNVLPWLSLNKEDAIALSKHFNLTAYDIDCSEFKALQIDANQADEDHYDECVAIQADKIKINKSIN